MIKLIRPNILSATLCFLFFSPMAFSQDPAVAERQEALQNQVAELETSLQERKKTIQELNSKVASLEQQVFNLLSGDFDAEAKKILDKQFETEHKQLITDATTLRTRLKSLTEDLESKTKYVQKLEGQKQNLLRQLKQYKSEQGRLTNELKGFQAKTVQSERLTEERIKESNEQLRTKAETLARQLNLLTSEREQKDLAVRRLNQKNAQLTEDLYASALEVRKVKDKLNEFQKRVDGGKTNSSGNSAQVNEKIRQLTAQLEESRKQNELLQTEAALLRKKNPELAASAQQPLVSVDSSLMAKKIEDLESQLQLQERFAQEKESQLSELQETNKLLNANLKKKMDQTIAAEKSLEQFKISKRVVDDQLSKLQADLKRANEQKEQIKNKSADDLNQVRQDFESKIRQLTQENESQAEQVKSAAVLKAKISGLEEKLESQEKLLQSKDQAIAESEKQKANSGSKIAELSNENKNLQEKIKTAQTSFEEIAAENKERHQRLGELDKEIQGSRQDIDKISQINKELEKDLALSNQKWQQLNDSISKTVQEAKKDLEQKISQLNSELLNVQGELKTKNAQLELAVKQKEYMVKSADQFLEKVNSLEKEVQQ